MTYKPHHHWALFGATAGVAATLGIGALVGRAAWQHDPYCAPIAGASSAVQILSIGGNTPKGIQLPPKSEVVCSTEATK